MSETSAPAENCSPTSRRRCATSSTRSWGSTSLTWAWSTADVQDGDEGTVALIDMTLTSAACPLTDVIEDQSRSALVGSGLVDDIRINWVWNPPWGPDKITEDGREQLRALGFTV